LDAIDRNTPRPEALYVDEESGASLVIERKNLVWPPEYAVGHKNDHFLVDLVTEGLRDLISDDPYELQLELAISGSRTELQEYASFIAETVRARFPEIRGGMRVGSTQAGRRWAFWRGDKQERMFEGAPEAGLGFHWDVRTSGDSSGKPPGGFLKEVSRLFDACVSKFGPYMDARRILVIEQHGDMRYMGACWWKHVLDQVVLPTEIQELWDGMFDWLDDDQQGWTFEKLYPSGEPLNLDLKPPKPSTTCENPFRGRNSICLINRSITAFMDQSHS
jgi:hypothetical protein